MAAVWIIAVSCLIGICCAWIGSILVIRRMAMLSDAVSHSVLPGIVAAYLLIEEMDYGIFIIAAAVTAFISTMLIEGVSKLANYRKDVSMGIIYTLLFSIGIILLSAHQDSVPIQSDHIIQGNLEMIPLEELWIINDVYSLGPYPIWSSLLNLVVVVITFALAYRGIKLISFDHSYASVKGVKTSRWNLIFMALTSLTVVISFSEIGAILVIGFIVIPPATALIFSKKLSHVLLYSSLISCASCIGGYFLARHFDSSVAGSICVVMGILFFIVFCFDNLRAKFAQKNGVRIEHKE